jgi:hypothetical protein
VTSQSAAPPLGPRIGRPHGPLITAGQRVVRGFGMATAASRPLPEFLIIGAKRGGSTSFYYDLLQHPQVAALFPRPDWLPVKQRATKGVHYFDLFHDRGERWYRSYLPSSRSRRRQAQRIGDRVLTGEASPYYLFHPLAAQRAAELVPEAKLIVVLRDPVFRTYSHWKERRRNGAEELDFATALAREGERVGDDHDRLLHGQITYSYAHEQQSYARQSEYDQALASWLQHYPREQLLVVASEEYYVAPQAALDQAVEFLGLRPHEFETGNIRNAAVAEQLDEQLQAQLGARFAPHNARLAELVGRTFAWLGAPASS